MTHPSRIEVNTESDYAALSDDKMMATPAAAPAKRSNNFARAAGLLLLVLGVAAAAFYGGTQFPRFRTQLGLAPAATPTPEPSATTATAVVPDAEAAAMRFARAKNEIDMTPAVLVSQMTNDSGGQPMASNDPEFLYLYGRALLLTGKHQEALLAFETATQKMKSNPSLAVRRDPLAVETGIATAAAALKSNNPEAARRAMQALDAVIEPTATGTVNSLNSPAFSSQTEASPVLSPTP